MHFRRCLFAVLFAALIGANIASASACACCTNTGQRKVEVTKINSSILSEIERLRFAKDAKLGLGEGYDDGIKGLTDPSEDFKVEVSRPKDRITFSLRDEKGRAGTLSLLQPKTVSVFEVDTRDDKEQTGYGPRLYKEWKFTTGVAGDGIFRGSVGPNRRITLVLHGRGNSCTDAGQFTAWTLVLHGPKLTTSFFGTLSGQSTETPEKQAPPAAP